MSGIFSNVSESRAINRRSFLKLGPLAALACSGRVFAAEASLLSALPERSLSFHNLHTGESLNTVYWAGGGYIPESLSGVNRLMRDHRSGEIHEIDTRLLDLLCELRMRMETTSHFELISGYRSPATNADLRSRSAGVAKNSLHTVGMAADIRIPKGNLAALRQTAISMKAGGVGYYPASHFVHVDVGRFRTW
jgi:uncharacterized protein YcbK (DUF882 family)